MEYSTILAKQFDIKEEYAANIIALLDDGNTIPFIARYRKEMHGSMDDQLIHPVYRALPQGNARLHGRPADPCIQRKARISAFARQAQGGDPRLDRGAGKADARGERFAGQGADAQRAGGYLPPVPSQAQNARVCGKGTRLGAVGAGAVKAGKRLFAFAVRRRLCE